jgi:hypothetical protein
MKSVISLAVAGTLLLSLPGSAVATGQPGTTAGVNCTVSSNALQTPGQSALSPGAPFNEPAATSTGGIAGMKYAGSGQTLNTPASPNAVSQYDVACRNVSTQLP